MRKIYIKHDTISTLECIADCKQSQIHYANPKCVEVRENKYSDIIYIVDVLIALWCHKYKIQAKEAYYVADSRIDGYPIIKIRNQLYKIKPMDCGPAELEYISSLESCCAPDTITKGGEMIDYKSTVTVKLSKSRNSVDNKLLLLV